MEAQKQQDRYSIPDPGVQAHARNDNSALHAGLHRELEADDQDSAGQAQAELGSLWKDAIRAPK